MDLVVIDPWSAGYYADYSEEETGRRLLRPLSFVRSDPDDINAYAHPIENLAVYVDMNELEVVRVEDYGVVPVPGALGNYTPRPRAARGRTSSPWRLPSRRARASR